MKLLKFLMVFFALGFWSHLASAATATLDLDNQTNYFTLTYMEIECGGITHRWENRLPLEPGQIREHLFDCDESEFFLSLYGYHARRQEYVWAMQGAPIYSTAYYVRGTLFFSDALGEYRIRYNRD